MGGMLLRLTDKLLCNTRGLFLYTAVLFLPGFDNDHGQQYCDVALCSLAAQLIFLNSLLLDIQSNFSGWDTEIQSLSLQGATNIPLQWDPPPPPMQMKLHFCESEKILFYQSEWRSEADNNRQGCSILSLGETL